MAKMGMRLHGRTQQTLTLYFMKLRFTIVMLVSMILASCSQKEEVIVSDYNSTYLNARIESTQNTKVGFTASNADFFWTKGDVIGVITQSSETFLAMNLSDDDAGKATGTFTGNISGELGGYAVYPFGEIGRHTLSGTALTYKLPAEYTYTTTDAEYAKSDGNSHNAPMWGAVNGSAVTFKHLGGVLAFEINNLPENTQNLKLTLIAEKQISGTFTADLSASAPVLVTGAAQTDADKKVTINFSTADGQTTGFFYIPVPTGEIGNLILTVTDANSTLLASGAWDNRTIERKNIVRIEIGNQSLVGGEGEVKSVSNVSEINSTVLSTTNQDEENLIVNVTSELSGTDNNISIPNSLSTETTTFSFSSVADGAKISITNGDGANYNGKIVIEIPEDETLPTIEANIPDGEVYIKQGNVENLVVSAAQNTTIIGEKAKVTNLTVNKGNIRILAGGKVQNITKGTNNQDELTYVIFEGGIPDELPTIVENEETIIFISAAEYDLRKAIEEAAGNMPTITLKEDVVLTSQLTINKSLTLNLNGKTISNEDDIWDDTDGIDTWSLISVQGNGTGENQVDVAIKGNGKLIAKSDDCFAVDVRNKAVLKIENGTFTGNVSAVYVTTGGKAYIAGGNYYIQQLSEFNDYRYLLNVHGNSDGFIEVTGGTFANYDPANSNGENPVANFVPAGYSSIADNNNNYTVNEGIYNEEALMNAVNKGGEITLYSDITLTEPIIVTNTVTINLNNKSITAGVWDEEGYKNSYVFWVKNGGTLTINGTGTIESSDAYFSMAVWADGGTVNINGGEYYNGGDGCDLIYAKNDGIVNINAGLFKATKNTGKEPGTRNEYSALNLSGSKPGTINVTGGRFYKFDPAYNVSENPRENFVEAGYSSVADGDWYEVKKGIYNELALNNAIAQDNATAELKADIILSQPVTVTKTGINLKLNGFDITAPSTDVFEVTGSLTIYGNDDSIVSAGTVQENTGSVCAVWAHAGGTVTIDGGYYKVGPDKNNKRNDCIYAGSNANTTSGQITINNGKFEFITPDGYTGENGDKYLINCADSGTGSLITVNGGTYKNYVPGKEPVGVDEVKLGEGKAVYNNNNEIVSTAHSGEGETWYTVKDTAN